MADKEYIERGALIAELQEELDFYPLLHTKEFNDGFNAGLKRALRLAKSQPAADVVSRGVYEQVQWERDMAMQQLEEHGIPFCGKADDVVEVVRCKDCGWSRMVNVNGQPEYYCQCWNPGNVIHVCALGFCVWGERKDKDDG